MDKFDWNNSFTRTTLETTREGDEWSPPIPFDPERIDNVIESLGELAEVSSSPGMVVVVFKSEPRRMLLRFVTETVYPGLYDNVEKLREWAHKASIEAAESEDPMSFQNTLDDVIDSLIMILTQDRGERDRLADPSGMHCRHGARVGGMGIDYMCGACEDGAE